MDCCLFYSKPRFPFPALPSIGGRLINLEIDRRPLVAVACSYNSSGNKCEFGGLNTPLEPKTAAGRFLCGVLLNDREYFHTAVRNQLEQLVIDRDEAVARAEFSLGSDVASLHSAELLDNGMDRRRCTSASRNSCHLLLQGGTCSVDQENNHFGDDIDGFGITTFSGRRIAELKKHECQTSVEDVMYMLIFYKFMEIRVHLVPRLSKCVYNGRLEICPSKDWELESIHDFEVLEMVKEHITAVVGRKANSNVTDSWTPTEIPRLRLCRLYATSILYGYFLKTAMFRYRLERGLDLTNLDFGTDAYCQLPLSEMSSLGSKYIAFGCINSPNSCSLGKKHEKLRCHVMGTLQMCTKPKSREALNLIERHCCALFGDESTGLLKTDNSISTSFASLKRFVLEAIAYGSFLWDAEECVNAVYKLEEN